MGCDIHLYFEKRNKDGKWKQIKIPESLIPDDRNYKLFSYLGGVRNSGDVIPWFPNRGIPDDSSLPEDEKFCLDIHSRTHAYLGEILVAPWEKMEMQNHYFYIFCVYIIPRLVSCGFLNDEDQMNIRVIIGFDN